MGDRATGFRGLININGRLWDVLRKSIVRQVAIAQRVRLDHVISRGCRQRQMTQLPFHGILPPPLWITLRLLGCFGTAGQTPVVLFLWSKVIGNVPFIEKNDGRLDRTEDRERGVVSPYLSNGKYSSPVSLTSVFEKRIGRSSTTIVFSFNWNPQIKIGYVPRVIIFRRYIVFS